MMSGGGTSESVSVIASIGRACDARMPAVNWTIRCNSISFSRHAGARSKAARGTAATAQKKVVAKPKAESKAKSKAAELEKFAQYDAKFDAASSGTSTSLIGVAMPWARALRMITPLRMSHSCGRPASRSASIEVPMSVGA